MTAKRALIVDDSKSARTFLSRILEQYEIDVDTAESAEVAIEYLTRHRPDVIFMDHLMPGMDGFQAVQAIKNNPRTATIPIMMYTSQEGELYLGQARALGAVGVLPKQIRPMDVSKVLYQLGLLPERRSREQTTFTPADEELVEAAATVKTSAGAGGGASGRAAGAAPALVATSGSAGPPPAASDFDARLQSLMREQIAELRRFVVANLENQAERIVSDVRSLTRDLAPAVAPATSAEADAESLRADRRGSSQWPWGVAIAALVVGLAMGAMWWREIEQRGVVSVEAAELRAAVAAREASAREATERAERAEQMLAALMDDGGAPSSGVPAADDGASDAAAEAALRPVSGAAAASQTQDEGRTAGSSIAANARVPYGEAPLSGARLETLQRLLARLATAGARGAVEVRSFPGRFCLVGNANDGFSLAPEESAYARCDFVGNPFEEALSPAQRESLAFANLVGEYRRTSNGTLDVRVTAGEAEATAAPYPAIDGRLTAGEWNRAAAANNRVEMRFIPQP
jgi:CheY-like chemotaxis protein